MILILVALEDFFDYNNVNKKEQNKELPVVSNENVSMAEYSCRH